MSAQKRLAGYNIRHVVVDEAASLVAGMLTTKQAAEILCITPRTLNRWVSEGRVTVAAQGPGVRGARMFDAAEVERVRAAA